MKCAVFNIGYRIMINVSVIRTFRVYVHFLLLQAVLGI